MSMILVIRVVNKNVQTIFRNGRDPALLSPLQSPTDFRWGLKEPGEKRKNWWEGKGGLLVILFTPVIRSDVRRTFNNQSDVPTNKCSVKLPDKTTVSTRPVTYLHDTVWVVTTVHIRQKESQNSITTNRRSPVDASFSTVNQVPRRRGWDPRQIWNKEGSQESIHIKGRGCKVCSEYVQMEDGQV